MGLFLFAEIFIRLFVVRIKQMKREDNLMEEKCVLITTDGYDISCEPFASKTAAQKKLKNLYHSDVSDVTGEWLNLCSISDDSAIIYDNGNNVYCYQIYTESELFSTDCSAE